MNNLGVMFTCYDEFEATRVSLNLLKQVYPDIKIRLFTESDLSFNVLEREIFNLKVSSENDTMSKYLGFTFEGYNPDKDYLVVKEAALAVISRIEESINFCETPYLLMMDPDAIVRDKLTIPEGVSLLGCRANTHIWAIKKMNDVLESYGGIRLSAWGATPAIFNTKDFLKAKDVILNEKGLLDDLCKSFYWFCAHDILLGAMFSLIGKEETFNPDILQCEWVPDWPYRKNPLLHQFRLYYPPRSSKYKTNET
jgi:hypothetical protein